ncbi:MAG: transposase [Phormidesmis priestleyi]|uniref:Transposase n=1 Tax=Phormidesmis priestleyi TaxID=268141 RepID=A0A2W4WS77_9CYAN|nr:MAG: transposase [Phormidesmis priestleyi]
MKIHYAELKNRSRLLQSLTGMSTTEFEALLPSFSAAWESFEEETFEREDRKRARGAGRRAELAVLEDKLLFILFYFRQYPTQEVQGYLFGIGQPQANEWIHRLTGVLNQALGDEMQLPERRPAKLKEVLAACPDLTFLIDGTERPINRLKDKDDQKAYYSGKKKAHTVKNNIITEHGGKVLYLSDTNEGKKHDKRIADEEGYSFPPGSKLLQDTGFQGYRPDGVTIVQPKKKPRGGELTPDEKIINRAISSLRVEVEHQIGGVKRCQIVVQKFRNRVEHFVDDVMETACGLHNFRLSHRQGKATESVATA